jgi:glycosyltransferase involved in cell wall biosynthesis
MVILSHPTGNANLRETVRAFNDAGLLSELWTSVYWRPDHPLNAILPRSLCRQLNRRIFPHIDRRQIRCNPWRESGRLLADRAKFSRLVRHETGWFSIDAVYRSLDRKVAARLRRTPAAHAVYAYEDGAKESFRVARELGLQAIYELPIGYWRPLRELMREEANLHPEWAPTLVGNTNSAEKHRRKDEELALASHIVVPSEFARKTLSHANHVTAPVSLLTYGAPLAERLPDKPRSSDKLKVIFVGSLSQRKGVSYLFRAMEILGEKVELTLIGRRSGECRALDAALQKHRWIPSLSHSEVLREIRNHDVMVFPSLFEGFGLVILEAMSCGVPVITTPNGAAPDVISNGEDGFIVPIRDAEAIAEKLEIVMHDRDRLAAMSQAAARKAEWHSWERYRARLVNIVRRVLGQDVPDHLEDLDNCLLACNS